ncbi:hypothetical protein SKAU_G00213020 [Synaphobranchus kaupii]|uniref:Uncharacterized protein n=1 Tax=Synaphobranchus kaupii TaxID=118154 RepID=A0A9Q1F9G1_SYNKA|nr:hypothetical protein SKAU_G00213020 [Synaphobranchus kaupii]
MKAHSRFLDEGLLDKGEPPRWSNEPAGAKAGGAGFHLTVWNVSVDTCHFTLRFLHQKGHFHFYGTFWNNITALVRR